jgi:EpsG family
MPITYLSLYYFVIAICLPMVIISMTTKKNSDFGKLTNMLVIAIISSAYLLAMARQDGIDYSSYVSAYYTKYPEIPDIGFNLFMSLFRVAELNFELMIITIGIVTLVSLRRVSCFFSVNYSLVLFVYFMHFAIVRDFAQLRSGFAVALILCALTLPNATKKWALYMVGGSMHYSVIPLIIAYEFCVYTAKLSSYKIQIAYLVIMVVLLMFFSASLDQLSFIDARIEIYRSWDAENYGSPVSQFSSVLFQAFLLIMFYFARLSWYLDPKIRAVAYLQIIGIIFFIAFKDVAIIAFRVSGAILSLYPVLVVYTLMNFRFRVFGHSIGRLFSAYIFVILSFILLFRPGSYEIVESIQFGNYPGNIYYKF